MSEIKCKKCDSNKIIQNAKITDFGHGNVENNLSIYIQDTDRVFFNKSVKGEILAQVCGNCGDLTLKIQNPNELWKAYTKSIK
jgi:Zn finger protein HypA/HybF involved in hydrogenase expression